MTENFLISAHPVQFSGCSGWLHLPSAPKRNAAVLLCPASGQDYVNGYRPLRVLGDRLAKDGYPVLRFSYPGTGDSLDNEGTATWAAWKQSVKDAATWLRKAAGVPYLIMGGVRIGAVLAAIEAAARDDVVGLVLFEPYLRCKSYISQILMERKLRKIGDQSHLTWYDQDIVELGELRFSQTDVSELRATDLSQLTFPMNASLQALIFYQGDAVQLLPRLKSWDAQGIGVTCLAFDAVAPLLRPNRFSGEVEVDAAPLLAWTRNVAPYQPRAVNVPPPPRAAVVTANWEERILHFGEASRLAGTLCFPRGNASKALVICNSGGNPRQGFSRFGVILAREMAKFGIVSLRFDFSGLGDSPLIEEGLDVQSDVFLADRSADFTAAIDVVAALGVKRIAVHGLCSGAFHAVRAAYADKRVTDLVSINLPWFSLRQEVAGPTSTAARYVEEFEHRKVRGLFVFGFGDPGLKQFERHFGKNGQYLRQHSGLTPLISDQIDHELADRSIQNMVIYETRSFLEGIAAQPADTSLGLSERAAIK